jgi:hypothetical protein
MEPHIYEQIDNQILRLLLYFGAAVITTLSSALAYLWHTWRSEQRERIDLDKANAAAMTAVANQLDNLRDALDEFRHGPSKT